MCINNTILVSLKTKDKICKQKPTSRLTYGFLTKLILKDLCLIPKPVSGERGHGVQGSEVTTARQSYLIKCGVRSVDPVKHVYDTFPARKGKKSVMSRDESVKPSSLSPLVVHRVPLV